MTAPARPTAPFARRTAGACMLLLGTVLSCVGHDATPPENGAVPRARGLSFAPVFPQLIADLPPALATGLGVEFNRVRVLLNRADGSVALDTIVSFPDGTDAINVALDVPLSPGTPASGEPLQLTLNYLNAAGVVVFTGGPTTILALPSVPGQPPPPPITVPVRYSGPGANAARVVIAPRTLAALEGDPFTFTAQARDAAGTEIPGTPILWSSLDTERATITSPTAGSGTARATRGTARIVAQLLTGPADTVTVTVALRARSIVAISGSAQTANAGSLLPAPLVVEVRASDGAPVAGVPVAFAVAGGGGSVGTASATTDAGGRASTTWRLGSAVGVQSVTATATGLTGSPVTFTANATPAVPTKLGVLTQPASTTAGATLATVAIAAQDAAGATMTSFTGPISIALGANPGGATLIGTTTVNAVAGVASFSTLSLNRPGTGYTLVASSSGLTSATTNAFDISSGSASRLEFGAYPTAAVTAGQAFGPAVVVRDASGNQATGFNGPVSIALAAGPAGGTLIGSTTVNASAGVASFSVALQRAGTYRLSASASGLTGTTGADFQVVPAGPAAIAVASGGGQSAPAGSTLPQPVVIQVTDAYGNASPTSGRTVTFAVATGGGSVSPASAATNAQGQASTSWTLGSSAGGQTLNASSAGLTPSPLTVGATATGSTQVATRLGFSVQPSNTAAGGTITPAVTVEARDSSGAVVPSYSGNVTIALGANPGASTLSGTLTVAAVNGVATFNNLSLNKAGTGYTLTAASGSLQGATSGAFNVTAAAPSYLFFTGQPSNVVAGAPISPAVVVEARDASGNVAASFTGNVTMAIGSNPGGSTLGGTVTVAAVNGVATFNNLTLNRTGTGYTLSASATGVTNAISGAFNVTAGPAAQLAFTVQPTTSGAGSVITPAVQVTARDAQGNPVTGFTGNVTVALGNNPGQATLGGTLTVAAVNGVATFGNLTVSGVGTGYTLTASASGLTGATSTAFDVGAGAGISWTNASGGSWSVPSNWSLGRVPQSADTVLIALPGNYTVTLDTTFTGNFILVGGGSGTQTLSLTSRTLTLNGGMSIGATGALVLTSSTVAGTGAVANSGTVSIRSSTVSAQLGNVGTVVAKGPSSISGALGMASGSTLRVEGDGTFGQAYLTVANGFTNAGTIELTDVGAGYGAVLQVTNGTLANVSTTSINVLPGAGGNRYLRAQLDNQGTMTVTAPQGLIMDRASSAHTNSGTIDLSGGGLSLNQSGTAPSFTNTGTIAIATTRTLSVSGGTFNQNGGTLGGAGVLTLASLTANFATAFTNAATALNLSSVTVNGPGTLTNAAGKTLTLISTTINAPLTNEGTLLVSNNGPTINGTFTSVAGSTIRLEGNNNYGFAGLTVANGFTNNGTIELTDIVGAYGAGLTVTNGTLVNPTGRTILSAQGAGGARTLTAQFDNQGTVTVASPGGLTLNRASSAHTNSGTFDVSGGNLTFSQSGTAPSFTNTGTITIAATRTLTVTGGTFNQNGGTLGGAGTLALTSLTANFATNVTNAATAIALNGVTLNGPGTLTNAAGKTLSLVSTTINAAVINEGTLVVLNNGPTINGTLTSVTGSTIRLEGNNNYGFAGLTVANGFTNNGTIELTDIVGAYGAGLTVTNGTLVNPTGRTILAAQGAGGARTLTAQLDNQGTVTVASAGGLTLNRASSALTNGGTFDVSGGNLTISQSGTAPSFTNTGTVTIAATRTLSMSGGTFNQNGGTLGGAGTLALTSLTANFATNVTNAATTIALSSMTLNGPGTLTNAAGKTLSLVSTTINAPVINEGTLVVLNNGPTINGALTSVAGSTIRLEGNNNYGFAGLTVANGFTNNGTIELTDIVGAYGAGLTVTNGTLVNPAGRTILAAQGANGARTLTAQLDNQGTVTVASGGGLTLNRASSALTNSGTFDVSGGNLAISQSGTAPTFTNTGTITIAATRTVSVSGGTFNQNGGTLGGAGTLALTSLTANFATNVTNAATTITLSSVTLNGPGTLTNAAGKTLSLINTTINAALINEGTLLVLNNGPTINGTLTSVAGSTIRIEGNNSYGFAGLTVANGFTNNGTIELTDVLGAYGAGLTVTNGTLVNPSGRTILAAQGANGARTLTAQLDNQGTVTVASTGGLTLNRASSALTSSGTFDVSGGNLAISQSGTAPTFTNTGTITIAATRTVSVSGGTFNQNAGSIGGAGTLALTSLTANFATAFTNAATALNLSSVTLNGPGTLTNAAGKTLSLVSTTINAPVTNEGMLVVLNNGSTINGTFTSVAGSTIRIEGNGNYGFAGLTVTTGFVNNGTIELTDVTGAYGAGLTVTNGTLTNAGGRTILAAQGSGGARNLNAALDNQGTLSVAGSGGLTINRASSVHLNTGTIDVSGGNLTITQSGTSPSFTNPGTLSIASGRTVTVSNGAFNPSGGTVNGPGTLSLVNLAMSLTTTFTNANATLALTGVAVNGASTLVNASGGTLTAANSTFNAPLTNQGAAVTSASVTINGLFSTASGSTLRVEGNGTYGAASLTVASPNGFTNNGAIELTAVGGGYTSALTVSNGTLANAVSGTVVALTGTGGTRAINGAMSNAGIVRVDGTTLTASQGFTTTSTGLLDLTSTTGANAALTITTGTLQIDSGTWLQSLAGAGGTRTVNGNVLVNGSLKVTPGGAGTLTVNGNVTINGTLELQVGGTTPDTQYDRLAVSGTLTLGGSSILSATTFGGFTGTPGDSFTVITYGSVVSGWEIVNRPSGWQYTQNPTDFVLYIPIPQE